MPCLAPTGRAARILGNKVKQITAKPDCQVGRTIHSEIYTLSQVEINEEAQAANDPGIRLTFPLKQAEPTVFLFVIDESSMIGDRENHGDLMQFGSGRLLKDLITFSRVSRPGRTHERLTKLLFVGDSAQLPPVGENTSPALSDDYLRQEYKLNVTSCDLNIVMRQAHGSAILERATTLRDALSAKCFNAFSLQPNGQDIEQIDSSSAVSLIVQGLQEKHSNVAVVYSNAAALDYNRSIRERRWGDAALPIQVGDALLVNRNSASHSLSNGDLVKVMAVGAQTQKMAVNLRGGHYVELYFRDVTVAFRSGEGNIIQVPCMVLENLLDSPFRELTPLEQRALLVHFRKRHPDLRPKSAEFRQTIGSDPYFNALQVKYGYAMTCHKAQGGEWDTVIVDFQSRTGARNASFFRWAYTAITRAAKKLVVVNPPDFTAVSAMAWAQPVALPHAPVQASAQNFTTDPDWQRLAFSAATAPLMPIHQQLRSVWKIQGIDIEQLQHLQYCERYGVVREGKRATVQYYYDKKHRISRSGVVPSARCDSELAEDALGSLHILTAKQGTMPSDAFIVEFLASLDLALEGSSIERTGCKSMPYRLRVSFAQNQHTGEIDFTYDAAFTWTAAQEVGGPNASHGLYDKVQNLMMPVCEVNP